MFDMTTGRTSATNAFWPLMRTSNKFIILLATNARTWRSCNNTISKTIFQGSTNNYYSSNKVTRWCSAPMVEMICSPLWNVKIAFRSWDLLTLNFDRLTSKAFSTHSVWSQSTIRHFPGIWNADLINSTSEFLNMRIFCIWHCVNFLCAILPPNVKTLWPTACEFWRTWR